MPYVVTSFGLRISYADEGPRDGLPLVLIHGLMGTRAVWADVAPALTAAGYRAVSYDLRGRGDSGAPPTGYSLADHAADLLDLMNHLALDSAVLCGLSLGGSVALEMALTHQRRVDGLVLIDSALAGFPYSEEFLAWTRRLRRTVQEQGAAAGVELWAHQHPFFARLRQAPERFQRYLEGARTYRANEFLHAEPPDPRNHLDHLRAVPVPALVLAGEDDVPDFLAIAATLATGIPQAEHRLIPDAGHLPVLEQPQAVVDAVLDWLGRQFPPAPR
ncbi:MAG TPA: alpha/beta fold hydrolase [Dehalococcoidia bacterium]